jgi:hypothetical protein
MPRASPLRSVTAQYLERVIRAAVTFSYAGSRRQSKPSDVVITGRIAHHIGVTMDHARLEGVAAQA